MIIMGLHYGHDGSVCIVRDGRLVSAISTERITRKKKDGRVTAAAIDYVLESAGITIDDIDCLALADYDRDLADGQVYIKDRPKEMGEIMLNDRLSLSAEIRGKVRPLHIINHHLAHCASAYYTSNYDSSWCFSMDSSGHHVSCNSLIARGQGLDLIADHCPGLMVGYYYSLFVDYVGLGNPVHKAGSLMGLASYANPREQVLKQMDQLIRDCYSDTGTPMSSYHHKGETIWERATGTRGPWNKNQKIGPQAMEAAASIQKIFEESILDCLSKQIPQDGINNLCLAGGSLLNCSVNTRIITESRFNSLHHFPGCGDDGLAVGSALYVAHHIMREPRHYYTREQVCYLGRDQEIIQEPDYGLIAKLLDRGAIIGWFMGASEYGPRALGHRSILADPRDFHKRELLNFVIKDREWFRPFAPIVMEEYADKWFSFPKPSPFMLYTAPVLHPKVIPAVTHVDGTARHQTVIKSSNPQMYNLLEEFYFRTGIPLLVNTSLNGCNEPILETEEDALNFFNRVPVDAMVINGRLLQR